MRRIIFSTAAVLCLGTASYALAADRSLPAGDYYPRNSAPAVENPASGFSFDALADAPRPADVPRQYRRHIDVQSW